MSAIGLRVGPFEICDEAAVPGSDLWYRAQRTGLSRRQPASVLVRLLGPAPTSRDLSAAQRQFDVLRSLDDRRFPTSVALYEGSGALAVEATVGQPLAKIIDARLLGDVPMTPATVLDLALDLTEAMAHAHGKGAHHGHLSADCVTVAANGHLMVWGMGEADNRPAFSWLAPELARGEQTTDQTDQWALGALIVALVTGRTPWAASSVELDPRSGRVDEFLAPLARQWPALGRLTRRMLDPNPQLRFPSLHPVRLELLALARRAGGTSDRRALGAWLHRQTDAADVEPQVATPPAIAAATLAAPTAQATPAAPQPLEAPSPTAVPAYDIAPQIDHAARGGLRARPRVVGPHASERMDVVRPVGFDFDVADPSEFDPSVLPTEMATEHVTEMADAFEDEPVVPPIRAYQRIPVATLPEMEVPEPSAPKPLVAVAVEYEDDEDDLMVEDPLVEITSPSIQIDPPSTPVQVEFELESDDLGFLDEPPAPLAGVVAFTNPDFGGPSLGLDMPEPSVAPPRGSALTPASAPTAPGKSMSMRTVQPEADSFFPDLGLEDVHAPAPRPWPWEQDPQTESNASQDPIVRVAPYLASGVVAALAVLLVVNVLV